MINNICFLTPEEAVLVIHAHHTDYIASVCTNPANLPLHGFTGVLDFLGHIVEWDQCSEALLVEACRTLTGKWSLILTDGRIEQGLPHTIHHCIVLSRPALQRWSASSLRGTLLHEHVHTLQKLHPERYDALYKGWGWNRMEASTVPHEIRERHRCNPDTPNWWYLARDSGGGREKWIPYVRIRDGARSLMDVDYLYAVVTANSNGTVHRYEKMGGDYRHMYHPEETAAVLGYTT